MEKLKFIETVVFSLLPMRFSISVDDIQPVYFVEKNWKLLLKIRTHISQDRTVDAFKFLRGE